MTMLDTCDYEEDDINVIATTIYRHMRSPDFTPDDIILGTVYISNKTIDKIIDFTKEDLTYICKQAFKVKKQNDLKIYRIHSNIYMENATTTEPVSEEATAKQKRIEELRK